ncbi:hypothetical protein Poli38472_005584 [Pythium oligandrum]|uniref:Sodium/calcium exchanger membrane region domain-containing protein n=1 Tax=Pythium oligandrum TaxID=41045 RepID=A0A8K1CHN4_PYTOL|nr:hypothetical protein Poli38472_005584 [Pythium oligandrum]|eukprot:TMW62966.1 hypothetical protein Poli38472_005584 [Pythium oligandrum]
MYLVYVSTAVIPECISRLRRKDRAKKYEVHHIGDERMPQESVVTAFWHAVSPVPPSQASSCPDVDCLDLSQTSYELASSPGIKHVKMEAFSGDVIHDHFRASIDTLESARLSDDEDSDGDFSSDEQLKSEETKRTQVSSGARVIEDELVAVLVALGAITKMSNSLLGATVLAWGNSIGDLATNISIARAGYPKMAIAGCYGGPVFNILVGLGLPMIISFARGGALMLEMDMQAWISLGFLSSVTTMSYMVFWRNNFLCPAWYGKVLVAVYIAYTAVNITMAVLHNAGSSES